MRKKYSKKYSKKNSIISLVLLITTVSMPLAFIPRSEAKAQNLNLSTSDYVSGIAGAIQTLPLCQDKINNAIVGLFQPISNFLSGGGPDMSMRGQSAAAFAKRSAMAGANLEENLQTLGQQYSELSQSVRTNDPVVRAKLADLQQKIDAIKRATGSLDTNDTCLKSIGRLIIKMMLQKITFSTIDWINHGFNGGPAFVQNPGQFFKDLAKEQILIFGTEINNPYLYPYGQAFMQNAADAFKSKFAVNAQYSLDKLIRDTDPRYSAAGFSQDFSQGGWDAWTYMTQIPANNPLGFQLMAANELQRRISESQQQTQNQLQESGGFLGDLRCVDPATGKPNNITKADTQTALKAGKPDPCTDGGGEWQYVTPGKLIATAATTALDYPNNNLLKASDLNDAIAAVLDALMNHFTSQLQTSGFANLNSQGANGQLVFSSGYINTEPQTRKDFSPAQLSSSFLSSNPDFNIRTDLTQALVDEQRTYVDKLKKQDAELFSTTDGKDYAIDKDTGLSNAYGLVPAVYQLDYCIPGPHPGWQADSQQVLNSVTNLIVPQTQATMKDLDSANVIGTAKSLSGLAGGVVGTSVLIGSGAAGTGAFGIGAALGTTWAPVVGTVVGALLGLLISGLFSFLGGDSPTEKLGHYYAAQVQALTGLAVNPNIKDDMALNILSKQAMVQSINTIFNEYASRIKKFFNPKLMPTSATEAANEFNKLRGYGEMQKNNQKKISDMDGVITRLEEIKSAVDELNKKLTDQSITSEQYEKDLKPQIDAFGRLSAEMVSPSDIAAVDNLTKQIIDEKNYVYDNLLKGPNGCEKDLELGRPNGNFVQQVYNTKRMTYPFPILYDYNKVAKGSILPDPWSKGSVFCSDNPAAGTCEQGPFDNTMTFNTGTGSQGPGFLSYVFFQDAAGDDDVSVREAFCGKSFGEDTSPCMIPIRNLFPLQWGQPTLGAGSYSSCSSPMSNNRNTGWSKVVSCADKERNGVFEQIIGIY